jgi:hypothetical protein
MAALLHAFASGGPMGWYAILAIVIFVLGMGLINRIEFGRFD